MLRRGLYLFVSGSEDNKARRQTQEERQRGLRPISNAGVCICAFHFLIGHGDGGWGSKLKSARKKKKRDSNFEEAERYHVRKRSVQQKDPNLYLSVAQKSQQRAPLRIMASGFVHIFVIATAALLLPGITAFVPQSSCGRFRTNSVRLEAAVSSSGTENAEEAKAGLRRALEESRGSSKAPGVEEAAEVWFVFDSHHEF